VTTTSLRLPWPGNGDGEAIWMVMLLRAEDGEEEPKVCLVATEDNHPTEPFLWLCILQHTHSDPP
jgi:hypothetical protein